MKYINREDLEYGNFYVGEFGSGRVVVFYEQPLNLRNHYISVTDYYGYGTCLTDSMALFREATQKEINLLIKKSKGKVKNIIKQANYEIY